MSLLLKTPQRLAAILPVQPLLLALGDPDLQPLWLLLILAAPLLVACPLLEGSDLFPVWGSSRGHSLRGTFPGQPHPIYSEHQPVPSRLLPLAPGHLLSFVIGRALVEDLLGVRLPARTEAPQGPMASRGAPKARYGSDRHSQCIC